MGYRTLLIDMDPQANSTVSFVDIKDVQVSMFDFLENQEISLDQTVMKTKLENLFLLPAAISLAKLESKLIGEIDSHFRLKDKLEGFKNHFDFIIIDTPPTLGLITLNSFVAATHLLVPIQSSYFALEGAADLLETYEKIKMRSNPELEIIGVLITLYDKRTVISKDSVSHIENIFGKRVFDTKISRNVRLEESPAYKESIFTFAPSSKGAEEYKALAEEILKNA